MGCWNGTCMVSHLPIESGEKVKLFFLYNISTYYGNDHKKPDILNCSGFVYSNDMLSPAFLPISGEYDDYGSIEEIVKDFNYEIILNTLKEMFKSKIKVDDEEKTEWDLNDVIRGIERGGCSDSPQYWDEKTNEWKDMNLSFTFVRGDVYSSVVESVKESIGFSWRYDEGMKFGTHLKQVFDKEIAFLKKKVGLLSSKTTEKEVLRELMTEEMMMDRERIFRNGSHGNQLFMKYWDYERYLESIVNDEGKVNEVYDKWFTFRCVERLLDATRNSWMVQAGSGSQDCNFEDNKKLSEIIINICDKKIEERRREYEGDWEEND
jgi:hypothetical protein